MEKQEIEINQGESTPAWIAYNNIIGPAMQSLAKLCEKHGFPAVIQVEFDKGECVVVQNLLKDVTTPEQLLTQWAATSNGNFDFLTRKVMEHADQFGHFSQVLNQLGNKNLKNDIDSIKGSVSIAPSQMDGVDVD